MFGLGVFPALLLFILLRFVLESPRWLWQKGRSGEAVAVFEKLGLQDEAIELTTAQNTAQNAADQGSLRELFSKTLRRPLLIALVLAVFAQLSGINAIMYYSTKIFQSAGVGIQNAFYSSVVIGFINLLFTIIAMLFVDRMGRRSLLLPGTFIQFVALAGVSFLFYQQYNGPLLLVFILVFIAAFASAMGPLPWIICSELFPTRIRGRAMSLATFALWSACYLVAQTFPYLNGSSSVGPVGTFGIFAGCSLFSFLFAFFLIPETKGKTLEEIENFWKKKGVAHE